MSRVPPHDEAAENGVMAAVLVAGALDIVCDILTPADFYIGSNSAIFQACLDTAAAGKPVDLVTIRSCLDSRRRLEYVGGSARLAELANETIVPHNVETYARLIVEKARLRRAAEFGHRLVAEVYDDTGPTQEWLDRKEQELFAVAHDAGSGDGPVSVGSTLVEALTRIKNISEGKVRAGFSTGLRDLDHIMGFMQEGDLIVVAGRPGMGKSSIVNAMAEALARGEEPVGSMIFSLEMPREQVALRMACADARVDMNAVRRDDMQADSWSRLTSSVVKLRSLPIWIDDKPAIKPLEIRARVRRKQAELARAGSRLGMVAIDYVQLCNGRDGVPRGGSREQEISYVSRCLKALAKECKVPVVALAQLNRAVEGRDDRRPMLSDLRESGQLEQDADAVVMVYRHEYYFPQDQRVKGIAELNCAKQRSGRTGRVFAQFEPVYTRFSDLSVERCKEYREYINSLRPVNNTRGRLSAKSN